MRKYFSKNLCFLLTIICITTITLLNSTIISFALTNSNNMSKQLVVKNKAVLKTYLSDYDTYKTNKMDPGVKKIIENGIYDEANKLSILLKYKKIVSVLDGFKSTLSNIDTRKLAYIIVKESLKFNFDPLYILALIRIESTFDYQARSPKGAIGLMQILPYVGKKLSERLNIAWNGVKTLENPLYNVKLGVYFLYRLEKRFNLHKDHALVAYNLGPAKVKEIIRTGSDMPSKYSEMVLSKFKQYSTASSIY